MKLVKASIVLVNFNTLALLKQCLAHLASLAHSFAVEIIVVDNGSTDGSRAWLATAAGPRLHSVFSPENRGFAFACNLGIAQAEGDSILLLNTDAFPQPGALDRLQEYLDKHSQAGIVGPQLLYPDGRWQRSGGRVLSPRSALLQALGITSVGHLVSAISWKLLGRHGRPRPVQYVDGACMLIRRRVIDQIGALDASFFLFVEDVEFCFRARQAGWQVVRVPQSRAIHLRGASSAQIKLEEIVRRRVDSERTFIGRTWGSRAWRSFLLTTQGNYCLRMGLAALFGKKDRYQRYRAVWRVYREERQRKQPGIS